MHFTPEVFLEITVVEALRPHRFNSENTSGTPETFLECA